MKMKHLLFAAAALGSLFSGCDPALALDWIQTGAPSDTYRAIASSADGAKLVAVSGGSYYAGDFGSSLSGGIYTSTNSGGTWAVRMDGLYWWTSVASSADGAKLAAVCEARSFASAGAIYTSADSGATWTLTTAPPKYWLAIAMSADGLKLIAADPERIFMSADSGASWVAAGAPTNQWSSVACSADGSKVLATDVGYPGDSFGGSGLIYRSVDFGTNWAATPAPALGWAAIVSSSDGTKLVALEGGDHPFGDVYVSGDSGATWTPTSASGNAIACSADGTRMVAVGANGIFVSADSGATWAETNQYLGYGNGFVASVAVSADGRKGAAAVPDPASFPYSAPGGDVYIWQATPTPTLSLTPSAGNALLSWTIPSMDFTLQQNSDLSTTNWTDVPTPPVLNLTNLQNQVIVPSTNGNAFYRLKH